MAGQGNVTVSALKAKFDTPISNNKTEGTAKKVTDRNARFKPPPDNTNHATIPSYNRTISATLDRKTNREDTHKRLSYTKTDSVQCDKSTLNGNAQSESSSRLSMTTNKINIPAAFSKETPPSSVTSTKQTGRVTYGGSRQGSKDSNSENSLENSPKKTYGSSGSPKNLVTDKGIAMREANEIKNLGEGLVKKRAELLFQNIHGNSSTTTKSKPSPPTTSDRRDSLPKGISMTNKGIIIRERDGKKFQMCSKAKLNTTQKCPCKPKKLESNQFQALLKQYRNAVEVLRNSGELQIEDRPSSLIPELTAEEEAELEGSASSHSSTSTTNRPMPPLPHKPNASINGSEPDQTYDDVMNTIKNEGPDDVYDDLETLECNTDNQELEKKKEKEKKEQEKEEKKRKEREEKERKKQEKEEKKIRTKFKMDGTEKIVGEGTYTGESCKGGKLELTVKKGDRINILRMHNNPAGKWLAKTEDGKVGYIDSQSVEICTSNIKNVMGVAGGSYANFTPPSGFPARYGWYSLCYGVCYAPGEEENSPDDIYEEIPKCD